MHVLQNVRYKLFVLQSGHALGVKVNQLPKL